MEEKGREGRRMEEMEKEGRARERERRGREAELQGEEPKEKMKRGNRV